MAARELKLDLSGEVVVLTGGGGVLCGTMARALAGCGAAVGVLDIAEQAAAKVADDITRRGGKALAVACDVLEKEDVERAANTVIEALGTPGVLINGAGGNRAEATTAPDREFFDLPKEAAQWVFNLNFIGTFIPCQVFGRIMAKAGRGHIINISSMNALRPLTKIPAYSAAKAAVSNFTQWLAVHMSQNCGKSIRVNAIAPGFFLTQQNRFLLVDERTGKLTARGATIASHTPMERFGEPEELVGTVLWLISDSSRFVHGAVIPVDGGFHAFGGV